MNISHKYLFISLVLLGYSCEKTEKLPKITEENLLSELNRLENVTATEMTPENDFPRQFALDFVMPVDHNHPDGQTYVHRVYLSHKDFSSPMVVGTSGYSCSPRAVSSITRLLEANQIAMPHRGYQDAEIDPMVWETLTVEQAAADNHVVIEQLHKIYGGKWITTGLSKGGMTALFHRRYYPLDVDAVIAVVAPVMLGYPDTRITDFVSSYGGTEYQAKVTQYQRILLENKDSSLYYFEMEADRLGLTFDDLGYETAFELGVLEYPVYLLQYRNGDSYYYETNGLSVRELFDRYLQVSGISFYSDTYMFDSWLFYYQAFTELGYYDLNTEPVNDLLSQANKDGLMLQAPPGEDLVFDETVMQDIAGWLSTEGDNIIYIYGANDPYTAAAADPGSTNSIRIIQDDADHSFSLDELDLKEDIYQALEDWLGVTININR